MTGFEKAGFQSTRDLSYSLERYQPASELAEAEVKELRSMFRNISPRGSGEASRG